MNKDEQYLAEAYNRIYLKEDMDFQDQMPDSRENAERVYGDNLPVPVGTINIGDFLMNEDGDEFEVLSVHEGDLIVRCSSGPDDGKKKLVTAEELEAKAYLPSEIEPE